MKKTKSRPFLYLSISMMALPMLLSATTGEKVPQAESQPAGVQKHAGFNHEKRNQNRAFLPVLDAGGMPASVIVTHVTEAAADMHILPYRDCVGKICYREHGSSAIQESPLREMMAGVSLLVHIQPLVHNRAYDYWLECGVSEKSPTYTFHTQRALGRTFQFIVQGDSHLERKHQNTPALYEQALRRIAQERPDFFITLGDDFSVDTLNALTPVAVDAIYRAQREYLRLVGAYAPLFLVNGNHEQAARCNLDGTADNVAVWAQNSREKYFAQPAPGGIYTGDEERVSHIGFLRDYYAWEWGDALCVVIDPYWHSADAVDNQLGSRDKNNDEWNSTLGDVQYQWLKRTLESSHATFKFVFTHHILGRGRGGVECTTRGEWGGGERKGAPSFKQMRPGWDMPIHHLLVSTRVNILFQGHDHLFCKQDRDGVIYQTCPLPAGAPDSRENFDAYRSGIVLPGSGVLRVSIQSTGVQVDFVRNLLAKDSRYGKDGETVFSYHIKNKL